MVVITMKRCTKCNVDYVDEVVFCPKCGSKIEEVKLQLFCPYCGKDLSHVTADFCPYCGHKIVQVENYQKNNVSVNQSTHINNASSINTNTEFNSNKTDNSEKSGIGGFLKSALTFIGFIFLWGLSKACGRGLVRGTTASQLGFFIGVMFAGIAGGIIPAFVAYKYCKFDNPSTVVWVIFIAHIIISFLSACLIIPIGSIPIGIIIAILLFCFNHK